MTYPKVDQFLVSGCGRCKYADTPKCKINPWRHVVTELRRVLLTTNLTEDRKWGFPCYVHNGKNVVLLSVFKDYASLLFFEGAGIADEQGLLKLPGDNSRLGRKMEFKSVEEVMMYEGIILNYLKQAIKLSELEVKPEIEPPKTITVAELDEAFANDPEFKSAFYKLTPGRQRGYLIHFSQPKQSATRASRIEKNKDKILQGVGLNDAYKC